jgi:hypothetical protein
LKKILTTIVLVVLIIGSFAALAAPHVRAQTTEAKILSYSWYISPSNTQLAQYVGDIIAVGEVENTGTTALSRVSFAGVAYNSTDEAPIDAVCAGYSALIGVPELLPGQKAPFYMDIFPTPGVTDITDPKWANSVTNVTVQLGAQVATNETQYTGLTIPAGSVHNYLNGGAYTVTGTVENSGDQTVGNVWVLVTYYNSAGTVVGMNCTNFLDTSGSLTAGNAVTFTAVPTDNTAKLPNQIANYSTLVEYAPYTGPSVTPTPKGQATPTPTLTPTSSSSTKNPSSQVNSIWMYGAIAAVVIVVAALVALMLLRSRRKSNEFGAPLPPPPPPPPPPP